MKMNWIANNQTLKEQKDPRIDSPHIKVVYPAKEVQTEQVENQKTLLEQEVPISSTPIEKTPEKQQVVTDTHTCTLSFQDAIKAHYVAFILTGLGILALGFVIGKNKI